MYFIAFPWILFIEPFPSSFSSQHSAYFTMYGHPQKQLRHQIMLCLLTKKCSHLTSSNITRDSRDF